jgi:hypothetical protein
MTAFTDDYVNSNGKSYCKRQVQLEISDELKSSGIITKFVFYLIKKDLIIGLNHKYRNKIVILSSNSKDWIKFIEQCRKRLEQKRVETNDIDLILDTIDSNYRLISGFDDITVNNTIYEDSKHTPTQKKERIPISFDEWRVTLRQKYRALQNKVNELFPEIWKPLEFTLSVKSILNIKDCTLPFIGIILGPPGAVKTLTIKLLRGYRLVFYTDNFSAKSFVSHNTSVKKEELQEIDLLPKIKNKLFLTPELSPTFSKRDDELNEILGIITRIADGHGYESDSGAQGHRGYNGEYMFTWLGAAVDIPRKVHKLIGTLGPKLYFYRLPNKENKDEEVYLEKLIDSDNFEKNFEQIKKLLIDYIQWHENCPIGEILDDSNNLVKIIWDSEKDDKQTLRYIVRLAKLLAHLRGVVPTWETRDTQGSEYAYTFSTKEEPDRAMIQLRNLARGHALSKGRNYITSDDVLIVIETVLSTASRERVIIFDCLLKHNGQLTAREIQDFLHITAPTALRTMTEFTALDLVDELSLGSEENSPKQIQLKQDFSWFLTEEFKKLRSAFGKEYIKEYLEEKQSKRLKTENEDLDYYGEHKEKNTPTLNNFYNTEQEYCNKYYPIMIYNKNQFAIQLHQKYE